MAYSAYVKVINDLRKHPNADRLQIATVFGSDVITSTDVQKGWKMVYFPSDGQLSEEFGYYANLLRKKDTNGENIGGYIDPIKRNIKAINLRKSRSDGILVSAKLVADFAGVKVEDLKDGDTITVLNGKEIVRKYIPKSKPVNNPSRQKGKTKPKESYPLFQEHKDTSQFRYNLSQFRQGDIVTVSLKLHGTSGRTSYTPKVRSGLLGKIREMFNIKPNWKTISGTRRVVLANFDGGYYGSNMFRRQYHELFDGKLQKGETVYYEIVGFSGQDQPIMSTGNNNKLNDKKFVKRYGETTTFTYGCENGQSDIYVYRMTKTDEDGNTVEYPTWYAQIRCEQMGIKHVPVIDQFIFEPIRYHNDLIDQEQTNKHFTEHIKPLSEGEDLIDPTHIREGVVVRIENRSEFTAFKEKNFEFKVLEGIIKEDAEEPDMEEAQDV